MTFSLLLSLAMAQDPSDGSDSTVESDSAEESVESAEDTSVEPTPPENAPALEQKTPDKAFDKAFDNAEAKVPSTPDVSLYSDFCPSGIKVPELQDSSQKRDLEQQWLKANLSRYVDQSEYIFIGEIAGHRGLMANQGRDMMVDVIVYDWLRGKEGAVISIHVPYNTPFIPGCPETVPPTVVDGYKMIFFVDKQKMVIEGNALYYLEAGYAWRNKRPDVFLSPRTDRDWVASDPAIDYVMYQLKDIRAAVDASNARRSFVAQADNEDVDAIYSERWWHFWK